MPLRKPTRCDPRLPWLPDARLMLAPMAGITDRAFRDLCRPFGAQVAFCEFVAAPGLMYGGEASWRLVDTEGEAGPVGVQLFGADPVEMGEAAGLLRGRRLDVIDVNLGCPARKVVRKNGGSALLADLPRLEAVVRAVVAAAPVPVTAKIRSGWDGASLNYLETGLLLQEAGCAWVCLHARTRGQKYTGAADLEHIARLVEALDVPVVGNGDVVDGPTHRRMVERTGCHAVMIGRGAIGNPWVFAAAAAAERGETAAAPGLAESCRVTAELVRASVAQHGERVGTSVVRKHIARTFRGRPGAARLRRRLYEADGSADMIGVLERLAAVARAAGPVDDLAAALELAGEPAGGPDDAPAGGPDDEATRGGKVEPCRGC